VAITHVITLFAIVAPLESNAQDSNDNLENSENHGTFALEVGENLETKG
jgi:hypothetical protein